MRLTLNRATEDFYGDLCALVDCDADDPLEDVLRAAVLALREADKMAGKIEELEDQVAELEAPDPEEGRAVQALVHELHGGTPMPNTALCVHPHCVRLYREC